MIEKFKDVLKHSEKVTLIIKGDDDQVSLSIIADPKKDAPKVHPVVIRGTYQEVEPEIEKALELVFTKNDALFSNAQAIAKEAAKAAEKKVEEKTKKKSTPAKPEKKEKNLFDNASTEPADDTDTDDDDDDDDTQEETPEPPKATKAKEPEKPKTADLFSQPEPVKEEKPAPVPESTEEDIF